jgi:GT2 family glycosyltransferase
VIIHAAFGASAARVAGRIAGDAAILACEPIRGAEALLRALQLRRAGTHFALAVYHDDVRATLLRERAAEFCATYATWDEVRLMLDADATRIAGARPVLDDAAAAALLEAIRLSDGIAVGSWAEHARLLEVLGIVPRGADIVIVPDPDVPRTVAGARTDVVVYAPHDHADELAAFIVTLGDLALPVTVIARDRPTIPAPVRFVPPEQAAEALGCARVIVDASSNDPGTALALAHLGRALVVASSSGAAEVLRGAASYDLWNRRSILAAVANALGASAPTIRANAFGDRPVARAAPVFPDDAPLVSVIVTTYERPVLLAVTLATIQAQTYPNVEIVVVNDAGSDVANVVARFPRARLIDQPQNRGPAAARNRGLAEARGTYATFFDDDDEMFPDHVATLANALLCSRLDVAYGHLINAIVVHAPDGTHTVESIAGHVALLDHADIQWAGALATTAVMFRRSLIETIGGVDETMVAAEDYEFWLRLAAGREWVGVPDITSLYVIRNDGSNRSSTRINRYAAAHRAIYGKHPSSRPLVQAGRASMLDLFDRNTQPDA